MKTSIDLHFWRERRKRERERERNRKKKEEMLWQLWY